MKQSLITKIAAAVAVVLAAFTIVSVVLAVKTSRAADAATETQTRSLAAARQVQDSSDYLTKMVRSFTATGDRQFLKDYWTEVNDTKSQQQAIDTLKQLGTPDDELALVAKSTDLLSTLAEREAVAMHIVLTSQRVATDQMPEAVAAATPTDDITRMSSFEKMNKAREMVFGQKYQDMKADIQAPIDQFNEELTTRLQDEVAGHRSSRDMATYMLAGSGIALVLILGALLWIVHGKNGKVVSRYTAELEARDPKDLTFRLRPDGVAEVRQLAEVFNDQNEQLSGVIKQVVRQSEQVSSASTELASTAEQVGGTAAETSRESDEAASAAQQVSSNISTVAAATEQMSAAIGEIARASSDASGIAAEGVTEAESAQQTMDQLSESSALIGDVLQTITSIAEQTNLLALNATIEAARAGESGKGFAVVAGEVKELARQSAEATESIAERVSGLQNDASVSKEALDKIADIIQRINESQTTIASAVEEQTATTSDMSRSVNEAATGAEAISGSINTVAGQAQAVRNGSESSVEAAQQMMNSATELYALLAEYRVDGAGSAGGAGGAGAAGSASGGAGGSTDHRPDHHIEPAGPPAVVRQGGPAEAGPRAEDASESAVGAAV